MGRVEDVVISPGRVQQLLESASAVSTTLAIIPSATTECALVRNQYLHNKTPE